MPVLEAYWRSLLRDAEAELDAATRRSELDAAAKRLMRIKAELRRLEQKAPTRQASGVAAAASS